jgi:hypothetical protein
MIEDLLEKIEKIVINVKNNKTNSVIYVFYTENFDSRYKQILILFVSEN